MPAPAPTIQLKRGLFVNLPALRAGEPGFTTDEKDLYIGLDGTSENNQFFGSSRYWEREDSLNNTSAVLKLVNPDGDGSVNLNVPVGHTGVTTYTLPSLAPEGTGHFLTADPDGILSWASVSANATFENSSLTGITTIAYIDGTDADFSGIATASSFYVDATKVLSTEGGLVTLSGIQTIDATTKSTLETILSLDPNDFDSLNVTGIATFQSLVEADGGIDVTGSAELDDLNVTGVATFTNSINASGGIDVTGATLLDVLNVSGIATFQSLLDASGGIDVTGNAELDDLNVTGVATFTSAIDADLLGNAGTATALETAQDFSITGDFVTATIISFDGTGPVALAATITANSIELGTYTSGDYVASFTAGDGLTGDATGEGSTPTLSVNVGAGITITSDAVAFKNAASLTDNTLQKWDDTDEQLVDTIITDNGSTATVGGNLTVTGDLTVNGTTTQVNTTELAVYDRTITLGIQTGSTPVDTSWDLGVMMNYGDAGVAKTAGFVWDFGTKRFQFASNADNPAVGVNTTTPDITVSAFAPIEIGGLYINNACSGGAALHVIGCNNDELQLMNIVVDGGSFT